MKKYSYKMYNVHTGKTYDTRDFEIIACNKDEAYKKAFDLSCNHDFQVQFAPYLFPLKSSFRLVKGVSDNG